MTLRTCLLGAALLIAGLGLVPAGQAQNAGLAFLRVGTNASALGMGSAQTAYSRDAFSTYWNPAGLAVAPSNSAALTHHVWIGDVRLYTLAARFQAGENGGLGLAVTAAGSGDIAVRTQPGDPDGFFSAQFISVGGSYARVIGPVSLGMTAKYLTERIFDVSANGYAFDAGIQVQLVDGVARLGAVAQHFGKMSELDVEPSDLPRTLRAGLAVYPLQILTEDDSADFISTLLSVEVAHLFADLDQETQLHVGAQAQILETIVVRGGLLTGNELWRFSLGTGVQFDALQFDYAYLPFRSGFGRSGHVLTLVYGW